jgi:hypothetical protein
MRYQVVATDLKGRHLVFPHGGPELRSFEYEAFVAREFSHVRTIPAGRISLAWKDLCADCIVDFIHLFPGGTQLIHRNTLEKWIENNAMEFP